MNAVCPGFIRAPMVERVLDKGAFSEEQIFAAEPMHRMGKPEEIAEAVLWLCSEASSFVTGLPMPVDGGYVAHADHVRSAEHPERHDGFGEIGREPRTRLSPGQRFRYRQTLPTPRWGATGPGRGAFLSAPHQSLAHCGAFKGSRGYDCDRYMHR